MYGRWEILSIHNAMQERSQIDIVEELNFSSFCPMGQKPSITDYNEHLPGRSEKMNYAVNKMKPIDIKIAEEIAKKNPLDSKIKPMTGQTRVIRERFAYCPYCALDKGRLIPCTYTSNQPGSSDSNAICPVCTSHFCGICQEDSKIHQRGGRVHCVPRNSGISKNWKDDLDKRESKKQREAKERAAKMLQGENWRKERDFENWELTATFDEVGVYGVAVASSFLDRHAQGFSVTERKKDKDASDAAAIEARNTARKAAQKALARANNSEMKKEVTTEDVACPCCAYDPYKYNSPPGKLLF